MSVGAIHTAMPKSRPNDSIYLMAPEWYGRLRGAKICALHEMEHRQWILSPKNLTQD